MLIANAISLKYVDKSEACAAIECVTEQMNSKILPQLRGLRRNFIGSVDESLKVFPPSRIYGWDRRDWERITSETDEFVFCHNDLAPQNIFIHPKTFEIVGIVDWEFSGFFPPEFELYLWKELEKPNMHAVMMEAKPRDLAFFGLKMEDMRFQRSKRGRIVNKEA